jgi:UDPglucose 6-dehydrogenase
MTALDAAATPSKGLLSMRIAMIGTGYVGLVSGACFSEFGFDVICVDLDRDKIARLEQGQVPIYEPGLEALVVANAAAGRLRFSTDIAASVREADIVFIAVGTPARRGDGAAEMVHVEAAARDIARHVEGYTVVVTKSTVPVGSARRIAALIRDTNPNAEFDIASNPEFLREGAAIEDFMRPDRVVIGVDSERARQVLQMLYRPLSLREAPLVFTGLETAELTKYAANAFLATKITFINEIADLCEATGANVQELARGIGLDGRIGAKFLHPGPGFGGSCFPKDTRALSAIAAGAGVESSIVDAVIDANERRKSGIVERIANAMGGSVAGKRIGILGISFKPGTDDIRDAPSLVVIPELQARGATVAAYDPAAMETARGVLPGVDWKQGAQDVAAGADALVILTEWNAFRGLDLDHLASIMRAPVLIDLRNIYTIEEVAKTPFAYYSVGRPPILPTSTEPR